MRTGRVTRFVSLRPGYRKHSLSLDEPLFRDLMLTQFLLSKIEGDPPTCLTDKGENKNWDVHRSTEFLFLDDTL